MNEEQRKAYLEWCIEKRPDKTVDEFNRDCIGLAKIFAPWFDPDSVNANDPFEVAPRPIETGNTLINAQASRIPADDKREIFQKMHAGATGDIARSRQERPPPIEDKNPNSRALEIPKDENKRKYAGNVLTHRAKGKNSPRYNNFTPPKGFHEEHKGGIKDKPDMPPNIAKSIKPKINPGEQNVNLSMLQQGFLMHVCMETDKGKVARPTEIKEIMGLGEGCETSVYKALVKKGFLKISKPSARRVLLIPLRRPDGREYESPQKVDGVTVCEPAFAEGYEPLRNI